MTDDNSIATKSIISLDRFPTVAEAVTLLDNFLQSNNYSKDYKLDMKGSVINFIFDKTDIALAFHKYICIEIVSNKLFSKSKATFHFEAYKHHKTGKKLRSLSTSNRHNCLDHKKGQECCPLMNRQRIYKLKNTYSSLNVNTPYVDQYELQKEEIRKNKVRWLHGKNFNAFIGKASYNKISAIDNYVARDPSLPAIVYQSQLRAPNKYSWRNGQNFYG